MAVSRNLRKGVVHMNRQTNAQVNKARATGVRVAIIDTETAECEATPTCGALQLFRVSKGGLSANVCHAHFGQTVLDIAIEANRS